MTERPPESLWLPDAPVITSGFQSSADRFDGEAERRALLARRKMDFGVTFLDDYCRGLLPHDLVLIAARTGAGKTALAEIIATNAAEQGRRVHYFALEAEPDEIERRLKFQWLAKNGHVHGMNYPDWYLGRFDNALGFMSRRAEDELREKYRTLNTYYKGAGNFSQKNITELFMGIREETDLIVLDHLHYVDVPGDQTENRAQKEITKAIRDCALTIGVPIIVVAHLKKRASRKTLVPESDDVMGSSDITKICTRLILLAPARDQISKNAYERPTYMCLDKDRLCGNMYMTALLKFDLRFSMYQQKYRLGFADQMGESFKLLEGDLPNWAEHAEL